MMATLKLAWTLKGRSVPRVRDGSEHSDWHADRVPCHDSRVGKGEFHVPSYDVEECPACGDPPPSNDISLHESSETQ